MFKTVVSTQDLLSDSQRSSYSSDSALFSLSQRQHSQNDFSQVRTQDLFTQNQSSGSQSECSFPQTKKTSMYDKWMSKGNLYKKDQTSNKIAGTSQQLLQQQHLQHQNKLKETEDRDLLQHMVNIVQDCSREVKCILNAVKERLENHPDCSEEKQRDILKAFLQDIWKHEDRMLQALEKSTSNKENLCQLEKTLAEVTSQSKENLYELEKQLAAKDAEIKQLQNQLEMRSRPEDLKQMAKAVRQELLSPQLSVENKLMEILEVTRTASEQHSEQLNQYKSGMMTNTKQYNESKTLNQKLIKDLEKRLQKDITTLRKDVQKHEYDWQSSLQEHLSQANAVYFQDIEKLIERILTDKATMKQEIDSAMIVNVKKDVQNAIQRQTKNIEENVKEILGNQLQKQQQQLQNLHKKLINDVASATEKCQNKSVIPLSVPVFEEKFQEYHADLKQQLEELHKNHIQEVQRVQKEIGRQNLETTNAVCKLFARSGIPPVVPPESLNSDDVFLKNKTGYRLQRRKENTIISPISEIDRSNLFSKVKQSSLTTGPAQEHSEISLVNRRLSASQLNSEVNSHQLSQSKKLPCRMNQKRKGCLGYGKKHGAGKKTKYKNSVKDKSKVSKGCKQRARSPHLSSTAESKLICDFSLEMSPDGCCSHIESSHLQRSHHQRNPLCSPEASTTSYFSSPAVSITVDDELVVVRRSRWTTSTTPNTDSCRVPDIFDMPQNSSPCMTSTTSQRSLQYIEDETKLGESRTRSQSKMRW